VSDSRTSYELSARDSDERVTVVARAARDQACDITIARCEVDGRFLELVDMISNACPGSTINVSMDGPEVRVSVLDEHRVDWAKARRLMDGPRSPRPLAVVPAPPVIARTWRDRARTIAASIGRLP
jgi:hypothetical protein